MSILQLMKNFCKPVKVDEGVKGTCCQGTREVMNASVTISATESEKEGDQSGDDFKLKKADWKEGVKDDNFKRGWAEPLCLSTVGDQIELCVFSIDAEMETC